MEIVKCGFEVDSKADSRIIYERLSKLEDKEVIKHWAIVISDDYGRKVHIGDMDRYFDLASVSKFMLAILAMQMIEGGAIKLEDTIKRYFQNADEDITLRDLLDYKVFVPQEKWEAFKVSLTKLKTKDEVLELAHSLNINRLPNSRYSNLPPFVLSLYLQKRFGKNLRELFEEFFLNAPSVEFGWKKDDSGHVELINDPTSSTLYSFGIYSGIGDMLMNAKQVEYFIDRFNDIVRYGQIVPQIVSQTLKTTLSSNKAGTYSMGLYVPNSDTTVMNIFGRAIPGLLKTGHTGPFVMWRPDLYMIFLLKFNNPEMSGKDAVRNQILQTVFDSDIID